jgi:glycolate dehydrogenase iron-sulfur subunit
LPACSRWCGSRDINAATIRLLRRQGCEVVIAVGSGCCGSLNLHMGREEEARAFARQNIRAWEKGQARPRYGPAIGIGGFDAACA